MSVLGSQELTFPGIAVQRNEYPGPLTVCETTLNGTQSAASTLVFPRVATGSIPRTG